MSGWKDIILNTIKLTDNVKTLENKFEKLTTQVNDIDKRVIRLETLVEFSKQKRLNEY